MTQIQDLVLLPVPRDITPQNGSFSLSRTGRIITQDDDNTFFHSAVNLQNVIRARCGNIWPISASDGCSNNQTGCIRLQENPDIPEQGYNLEIKPDCLTIQASRPAGAFYAVMTLKQIFRQTNDELPCCQIYDYPDLANRGVMLDISRDKVPTMGTLYQMIDMLAEFKINHFELYTEHTFAYENHREVWAQSSPMTAEQIMKLDKYCEDNFIDLVPNQNSFGHMQRWLSIETYNHLAECPDGSIDKNGRKHPRPVSLNPTDPGSIELIKELYEELLPNFTSKKFNVGCDETFDLGCGKSKALCDKEGEGTVYVDFLSKIYELVRSHGRTMHFWADIIHHHPELISKLPKNAVALIWGYDAGFKFQEQIDNFKNTDIDFYICPGTSSWNTLAGRTENCLINTSEAADHALGNKATGYLNTDWGDNGHWQTLPVSFLGYAAGAAYSWAYKANKDIDLIPVLDLHAFHDSAGIMGKLAYDLGNTYKHVGKEIRNQTVLFNMLNKGPKWKIPEDVTVENLKETMEYIDDTIKPLYQARMKRDDADLIYAEFENAASMMKHACKLGIAKREDKLSEPRTKQELAKDMRCILGKYRENWIARNRIGGLHDSIKPLEKLLEHYTS